MAIGFIPKHVERVPLNNISTSQFLVIAIESLRYLKWDIDSISNLSITAHTRKDIFNRNAVIKINFDTTHFIISSASAGSVIMDWGKNKTNIKKFLKSFNYIRPLYTADELMAKYNELKESESKNKGNQLQ